MSDAKNINEVTQITTVESADYLMVSDISDASLKRATVADVGETLLGTTDISSIGDGTVTGAISTIDSGTITGGTIALTDDIVTQSFTHAYTIAANGDIYWNPSSDGIELSGYTPIGILNLSTGNAYVYCVNQGVGSSAYAIYLRNTYSSSFTANCTYTVLYKKS